jgi:hypothetical protein
MRDRRHSRGLSLIERKQAAEPFASADAADDRGGSGEGDDVPQALMVALDMIVVHELAEDAAQMTLAEGDDVPEALVLDGANKSLGVGVQVRAVGGQAQEAHARGRENAPEVRGIERIAVDDPVTEARPRAVRGVGQVAGDLRHPRAVRLAGDASDVNAARLEVDDEQHEVAHEGPRE